MVREANAQAYAWMAVSNVNCAKEQGRGTEKRKVGSVGELGAKRGRGRGQLCGLLVPDVAPTTLGVSFTASSWPCTFRAVPLFPPPPLPPSPPTPYLARAAPPPSTTSSWPCTFRAVPLFPPPPLSPSTPTSYLARVAPFPSYILLAMYFSCGAPFSSNPFISVTPNTVSGACSASPLLHPPGLATVRAVPFSPPSLHIPPVHTVSGPWGVMLPFMPGPFLPPSFPLHAVTSLQSYRVGPVGCHAQVKARTTCSTRYTHKQPFISS